MADPKSTIIPSFDLAGKRALVSGASRGIGLAAAQALAAYGAHVTLAARPSADLEAAVAAMPTPPQGAKATVMGEIMPEPNGIVALRTSFGGSRIVDMLVGDPLPRIC